MDIPSTEDYDVIDWKNASSGDYFFSAGEFNSSPIEEVFSLEVDFTEKHPPRDLVSTYIPVMSSRFIKALRDAGVDNLQTYPVILENSAAGLVWENFFIVNVVGKVACADLDLSEGEELLGGWDFDELVIDVEKARGALFFRLLESPHMLIAHYDVARVMFTDKNEPRFHGVYFEPIKSTHNVLKKLSET